MIDWRWFFVTLILPVVGWFLRGHFASLQKHKDDCLLVFRLRVDDLQGAAKAFRDEILAHQRNDWKGSYQQQRELISQKELVYSHARLPLDSFLEVDSQLRLQSAVFRFNDKIYGDEGLIGPDQPSINLFQEQSIELAWVEFVSEMDSYRTNAGRKIQISAPD